MFWVHGLNFPPYFAQGKESDSFTTCFININFFKDIFLSRFDVIHLCSHCLSPSLIFLICFCPQSFLYGYCKCVLILCYRAEVNTVEVGS